MAKLQENSTFECNICQDTIDLKYKFNNRCSCTATFCYNCIETWESFGKFKPCPVCKGPIMDIYENKSFTKNCIIYLPFDIHIILEPRTGINFPSILINKIHLAHWSRNYLEKKRLCLELENNQDYYYKLDYFEDDDYGETGSYQNSEYNEY